MKTKSPQTWLYALVASLAAALFVSVTSWLLASPLEQISNAVSANGATSVKQANADAFVDAVSSVLVTVKQKDSASYVAAAVTLRPDLKDQVAAAAQDVYSAPTDNDEADRTRVSRHRHEVPICCQCPTSSCHTIFLPPRKAREFLERHPQCMRGACPPG